MPKLLTGSTVRGKNPLRMSRWTTKGSSNHWHEQHAVNEFAETGFYNWLHGCQVLSEEASGCITVNCHCARRHWPALISWYGVREVRGRHNTRRGEKAFIHILEWIYKTWSLLNSVLLSWGVSSISPRPFPHWITSVITSSLCSRY